MPAICGLRGNVHSCVSPPPIFKCTTQEEKEGLETIANKESQMEEKEKSDQMMQAEAILNAIKGQEKINQKHKILKSKAYKYDKDW